MACNKKSVAIIGAGPAGCVCAYFASQNPNNIITLFDYAKPLHTLLYTGGGRCNLAYAEYNFKELAEFYPRGQKFLYSVFSQFSTTDTIKFFNQIGIKTYTQDDLRIFPLSNSAKDVRDKILKSIKSCQIKKEKVLNLMKNETDFIVKTDKQTYHFDKIVIATGGHAGFKIAQNLGHNIVTPKPSLTGLITKENFKPLQGVSLSNIKAQIFYKNKKFAQQIDDLLFTHEGISGPLAYKISSICARLDYNKENPLIIVLNFSNNDVKLQDMLNSNPQKTIKNLLAEFIPKSLVEYILRQKGINSEIKCCNINSKIRDLALNAIQNFKINVISPAKEGEIVTSGGVDLNEINAQNMQSKLVEGLYFCGEVIDVDGFCGGFNLQNCWSTGYITGKSL